MIVSKVVRIISGIEIPSTPRKYWMCRLSIHWYRSTNCILAVVMSKSAYNDNDNKNVPPENPSAIFLAN
jgi:hypothetical protein